MENIVFNKTSIPFAVFFTTGATSSLDPRYAIGLNTAVFIPFAPNLAVVFINGARPYL